MEEKKPTDEQKSMYELNVYRNRYYAEPQGTEKAIIANAINDLFNVINCLHERNAGLNDKNATLEYENSELKQRVSILEADNDDYKDKIAENELVSIDWHNEQVGHLEEEIERLTKRCELADKDNDNLAKTIFDYEKQVDDLKERYLEESKERCKFEHLYNKKCHEHNIGLGVQRKHWENKVQQAVKDTAKEILGVILAKEFEKGDYLTDDELHEIFKERYGVEVE